MNKKLILPILALTTSIGCANQVREVKKALDNTIGMPIALLGGSRRATIVDKKTYWFQKSEDLLDFEKHNNYSIKDIDSDHNNVITKEEYSLITKTYASK